MYKRQRIDHLEGNPNFHVHYGDLSDSMSIMRLVGMIKPDEIYNLAAQSHVGVSFDVPEYTADVVATGVLRILEAVRLCGLEKTCRIYQASTSELYGKDVYKRQVLFVSTHETILPTLLRNYDRDSMASGVEIRMPFLDYRIVEFAFSIGWKSKLQDVYKRQAQDRLPGKYPSPG